MYICINIFRFVRNKMAHFQYLCNECLLLRTHEAPSHNKVSFSQLALSDVPCDKIVSSAVSEISHIERRLVYFSYSHSLQCHFSRFFLQDLFLFVISKKEKREICILLLAI